MVRKECYRNQINLKLNKTIKNLRNSRNSFFNVKNDSYINLDLLKEDLNFHYKIANISKYHIISKYKKVGYDISELDDFAALNAEFGGYYPYFIVNKLPIDDRFYMKILKNETE